VIERYFVVMSIGHSGSAWLAKLLNSHFDVMCFHELECITYGEGMPPRIRTYNEFSFDELLRNLMYIFATTHRYGDAYKVLGTVDGAINIELSLTQIAATFPEAHARTHYYLLMRNPISQVHSNAQGNLQMPVALRQKLLADNSRLIPGAFSGMDLALRAALQSYLQTGDDDTQFFIHACLGYLRILWSAKKLSERVKNAPILQLERLSEDPSYLQAALKEITGLDYALDANALHKVNVKSGARRPQDLWGSWSPLRQRIFLMIFEPYAELLDQVGYSLKTITPGSLIASDNDADSAILRPPTLDELQERWTSTDMALRDTRLQLTRATEALGELHHQYEDARRMLAIADGLGPRTLKWARGLKRVWTGCHRCSVAVRTLVTNPATLLCRAPAEEPNSIRKVA
jgi:hypothetical protein